MATNLRDRGYSSSMDGYKKKKEETLTLPSVQQSHTRTKTTASGTANVNKGQKVTTNKVSTPARANAVPKEQVETITGRGKTIKSAPVSTMRFSRNSVDQNAFNRSPALIESFGTFDNYMKNKRVTPGGYSTPTQNTYDFNGAYNKINGLDGAMDFQSAKVAQNESRIKTFLKSLPKGVDEQFQKFMQANEMYEFLRQTRGENDAQTMMAAAKAVQEQQKAQEMYDQYQSALNKPENVVEYTTALQSYAGDVAAFNRMFEDRNKIANEFNTELAKHLQETEEWERTIRRPEQVEADIERKKQLIAQREQDLKSANYATASLNLFGQNMTPQQLEKAMNTSDEVNRINALLENDAQDLALLQEELELAKLYKWKNFATQDIPVSAQHGGYKDSEYYDIINDMGKKDEYSKGNRLADMLQTMSPVLYGTRKLADEFDPANLAEMLPEEVQTYKKIYEQQGRDAALAYYHDLEGMSLNTRRRATETQFAKDMVKDSKWLGKLGIALGTSLASPAKLGEYLAQAGDYLSDGKLTTDASYNRLSYITSAMREQIGEDIDNKLGPKAEKWGVKWGSFGYQTLQSMGDFIVNMAITGGYGLDEEGIALYEQGVRNAHALSAWKAYKQAENLSLALMGTEAAADAVMEAKDRGLSDGQAFTIGTAAGAIEVLTEKVSIENLMEGLGNKNKFLYLLKNMVAEGSEEAASDMLNLAVDIAISKDQSEWRQDIEGYKRTHNVSDKEALQAVWLEQLKKTGLSALGGALSGGIMAGSKLMSGTNISNYFSNRTLVKSPGYINNVINKASNLKSGAGYDAAQMLQNKMENGEKISFRDVSKAEMAIDEANLTDRKNVREMIRQAEKYEGTEAESLAKDLRAKLAKGQDATAKEAYRLQEALIEEQIVDPNNESIQYALKQGKASQEGSDAYSLSQAIEHKISTGEKLTAGEVYMLEQTVDKAVDEDMRNKSAEAIGNRLIAEDEQTVLKKSARILENTTNGKLQNMATEITEQIQNGNIDSKLAGDVFLEAQRVQEATTEAQLNTRILNQREVTEDMDEYDASAARAGVSTHEAERVKSVTKALNPNLKVVWEANEDERYVVNDKGERVEKAEGETLKPNEKWVANTENGRYDSDTGTLYLNAKSRNPVMQVVAHEVTHSLEQSDSYDKLQKTILDIMRNDKTLSSEMSKIQSAYQGKNLNPKGMNHELVAFFVQNRLLTDEQSIRNVVNQNRTLGERMRNILDDILAKFGNKDAQARKQLRTARDLWSKALKESGGLSLPKAKQTSSVKSEAPKSLSIPKVDNGVSNSITQTALTAGMDLARDGDGRLYFTINGKKVTHVSASHIKNGSAFGALIKAARDGVYDSKGNQASKGHITSDEANKQFQAVADLMNMIINTQNPEMVWALAGSQMFAAVKSNSDGQYGTTVDFTTVCRKTLEMITAMSERMMERGRGLTKAEVTELQGELIKAKLQVPCPVCYVFSRWAGVGTLLDNMKRFQDKYADYTDAELQEAITELKNRNAKEVRKSLREGLRNRESSLYDDAYEQLASTKERLQAENKQMRKELKTAEQAQKDNLTKSITFNEGTIKNLDKQMKEILDAVDTGSKELVWLQKVRTKPGYKAVPDNVLFNMGDKDAVESFIKNYSDSWKYRTTRGPAMGKAIVPYADMRLGDFALPLNKNSANGRKTVFSDPLKINGEFNRYQKDALAGAIARVRAQNLIGGQRFQSTSDFRYDYALDYIQTFFEAQALGSNMQTYTKIIEFGEMVAKIGGDVNLSVMPSGKGYENGHLVYSNVTGINYGAADALAQKYDSAQLILVGINDEHIRLALEDSEETGGSHVGFIIPYHASGASIDTFIRELVKNLNEEFKKENYTDYSTVQTDTIKSDATATQRRMRNLRKSLLTGTETVYNKVLDKNGNPVLDADGEEKFKKKTGAWNPKSSDIAFMKRFASEKIDITGRSFEELLDIENRALNGDPDAIHEYERWSSDALYNLYKKMWTSKGTENGVRLNSAQAEAVMPHEYWDRNSTRDTAYLNDFLFRSYCYNLGLHPRFTGIDSKGNTVSFGNFRESKGYWKTLIDRSMYNNDGTYRDQKQINLSEMDTGFIDEKAGRKTWGDAMVKKPDVEKAKAVGRGTLTLPSVQHSQSVSDASYLKAVNSGDMKTAQRMVDDAAKKAGYTIKAYHGTELFGFTKISPSRSNSRTADGNAFYTTTDLYVAGSYSGTDGVREIGSVRNASEDSGNYQFYIKPGNLLEIDANGRHWNKIPFKAPEFVSMYELLKALNYDVDTHEERRRQLLDRMRSVEKEYQLDFDNATNETRKIVAFAKSRGYDGVIFKNVIDVANEDFEQRPSDVYALFHPQEQAKSADPVTYDDSGKPIPLSKRFNDSNRDIRYSNTVSDDTYLKAVESGDMAKADSIIEKAARKAGFNSPKLYHGTNAFGFTVTDTSKSDDGVSFFATSDADIARTYTAGGDVMPIAEADVGKRVSGDFRHKDLRFDTQKDLDDFLSKHPHYSTEEELSELEDRALDDDEADDLYWEAYNDTLKGKEDYRDYERTGRLREIKARELYEHPEQYGINDLDRLVSDLSNDNFGLLDFIEDLDRPAVDIINDYFADVKAAAEDGNLDDFESFDDFLNYKFFARVPAGVEFSKNDKGIYALYGKLNNFLEVDGKGARWSQIPFAKDGKSTMTTRQITKWAKKNGYSGVVFRNIEDNGNYWYRKNGDVYAFFDPQQQVKSADTVTRDENGNIIPPSERFSTKNDLRYSRSTDDLVLPAITDDMESIQSDIRQYAGDTKTGKRLYEMAEEYGAEAVEKYIRDMGSEGLSVNAVNKYFAKEGVANALNDYLDDMGNLTKIPGEDKISTGTKQRKKAGLVESGRNIYRKMVDSGEAVGRLGKYTGDPHLYHYYNMARASSNAAVNMITQAQTNVLGQRVGEGLNEIFKDIRAKGDDYYRDLQSYLLHLHNIDRMSRRNPALIGMLQAEMEQYKLDNPELGLMTDAQIMKLASDPISQYYEQAREYTDILNKLNKAERTTNKPIFGDEVTAKVSQQAVDKLLPRLEKVAGFENDVERIYKYIDNMMQYRIDSGLVTEEDYKALKEIYPHYVPTFRIFEDDAEMRSIRDRFKTEIGKTVKRATGGTQKIMPLHRSLANQTFSVVREGSKNRFGQMLLESKQGKSRGMIKNVAEAENDFHEDTFDQLGTKDDPTPIKANTFTVRQDGKRWDIQTDDALYEAVTALSPSGKQQDLVMRAIEGANTLFKELCTGYNPTFLVRNVIRDLQDAGLYSKDLSEFIKQFPQAYKEISKNGKYYQQYKALGGLYSSVFDYQTGEVKQSKWLKRNTLDRFEALNMALEQAPRLAEFMATVKKAERNGPVTMDTLMEAMYNAADVTVNFGRGGEWGKFLNRNFVPFLNPGIQGFDKMIRNVTETNGFKDWARLVFKATLLGVAPAVISNMLFGKRKDWDEIKDRDKDIYYLFPLNDDGLWLKLPKGRVLSIIGMGADRAMDLANGKDVDWGGVINTAMSQTAPANPLTNNIWQPVVGTKLFNPSNPGETWYGSDIESQRLQNLEPGQRYDATTDALSKWLGKTFNLSPKKISYLLDQYTGVIGDILIPLTSDRAEKDPFTSAFTLDSTMSNRLSEDFYDRKEKATWAKNGLETTPEDESIYKYLNQQNTAVSDINKAIREIEADKTLSDKDKQELVRVQYALRNGIMRNALDTIKDYESGGTDNEIAQSVQKANEKAEVASKTYTFNGKEKSWDDLTGKQQKIAQCTEVLKSNKNADEEILEILGERNAKTESANYIAARDAGISPTAYVQALKYIDDSDDGNGKYVQDEVTAGLDKMVSEKKLTKSEASDLWFILTQGAEKNNPYLKANKKSAPMGLRLPKIG